MDGGRNTGKSRANDNRIGLDYKRFPRLRLCHTTRQNGMNCRQTGQICAEPHGQDKRIGNFNESQKNGASIKGWRLRIRAFFGNRADYSSVSGPCGAGM